ncbi:DUF2147 domain-containing protein [Sphingomonas gilva]|uniref:DUF2147 domain-containing protein n=1 Tax=Sphingomonas gilva TaxID=2305907 RepID=A0A396RRA0_9SPHN|nr:DUF2147 domain-containing protein [Sphingomonas gilva]RHW19060.1 DUF2147 domain-containing protein [Sphingomonas gilva]
MKRALLALALLSVPSALPAAGEEALIGRWNTQKQGGVVEIHRCGQALCGRVVDGAPLRANPDQRDTRNPDKALRGRRVMGLRVLHGFTGGPREWKGGPLYDPETGDGAKSGTLTLVDASTLKVKGCLMAFLCRTQTWTRVR